MTGIKIHVFVIFLLLTFRSTVSNGQDKDFAQIRLMFYNVENLFDTADDSLTDDEEFLPGGSRGWTGWRFKRKTESLYKTIMAAGEWNPPVIVAFCEVENRSVLETLVYRTGLSKFGYRIIHEDSPDRRGIDVCLIYRSDRINLINSLYWIPADSVQADFRSRSVLYSRFSVGNDTLHIMMNHWPSRRGGILATRNLRGKIARMVRQKADSLFQRNNESKIIIAGDFNSIPGDPEMKVLTAGKNMNCTFINLSDDPSSEYKGTYKYKGIWQMIDQVLVSESILSSPNGIYADSTSFKILRKSFLLVPDEKYTGLKPFSTYAGYIYQGGFSDHLPVILDLRLRKQD